jgi:hypothetical protein
VKRPPLNASQVRRIFFLIAFFSLQITICAFADSPVRRGDLRSYSDGAFAFRMFPEWTTVSIHLKRSVGQHDPFTVTDVANGTWVSHTKSGELRTFAWRDRVRQPELSTFDVTFAAPYGANAEVMRLHEALLDVCNHLKEDVDTNRLSLAITVRKNGHEPYVENLSCLVKGAADSR